MTRKVITAGIVGGLTIIVWTILMNVVFGFRYRLEMKQIPDEATVYQVLKQNVVEPGRYLCNPPLNELHMFPENEPVFSVLYAGIGHEAAGPVSVFLDFLFAIVTATLCAWLLSLTSEKVLSGYLRRVSFVLVIGLLFAFFSDSKKYGIGNYPLNDALILALNNFVIMALVGLVISLFIKPEAKKLI